MAIKQILYTDFLPTGFDKTNENFGYLDTFGRELPRSIANSMAWATPPALLYDLFGRGPSLASRLGSASYFDYFGNFLTAIPDETRLVPGVFGSKSAIKLEAITTNLHPQAVVIDTSLDGIADTWTRVGNPLDCLLSLTPSSITGDDQKILSVDCVSPAGIETVLAASVSHVNKTYILTVVAKAIRGLPTDFNAIVRGYNAATAYIYSAKQAFTLFKSLPNGYGIYTAEVTTPDVIDFGNIIGFTGETIATVSVGLELASTLEITYQIWHIQIQEEVSSSPIRTNGVSLTTTADNLTFQWPSEVTQAGSLVFWAQLPKTTTQASYTVFGEASTLHLTVTADRDLILSKVHSTGTTTTTLTPTLDIFDGNFHQFIISWDNYLDQYNLKHTPLMLAIDGVDQLSPLAPSVTVDPKTQRRCINDEALLWINPTDVTLADTNTFIEIDNPYLLARAVLDSEVNFVFNTTVPISRGLNIPLSTIRERQTLRWNFRPSLGDTSADLAQDDFIVTGGPQSVFNLSWSPTDIVVSFDGTIVDSSYGWVIAGNQVTFTPAVPDTTKVKIFGVNPTPAALLTLPQLEINGAQLIPFDCNILSARLIINTNSGTIAEQTEINIKANNTTIFSTRPAIAGDAGNSIISSNQVLSVTNLNQNDILTLDLTDYSDGVLSVGVELLLESI